MGWLVAWRRLSRCQPWLRLPADRLVPKQPDLRGWSGGTAESSAACPCASAELRANMPHVGTALSCGDFSLEEEVVLK